ncbi:MAG: rhodanese-like domain-containing protein [Chloroflexi bacterium]|nr:rhodanese-like domain-containing protein [Chloroflexota bacterium]
MTDVAALTSKQVQTHLAGGAIALDLRRPSDYGAGHIKGSLNIPVDNRGSARLAAQLIPIGTPLVLVANDNLFIERAISPLREAGHVNLRGYLARGVEAWLKGGLPLVTLKQISAKELLELREKGLTPLLLDVREPIEWELGYIEGSILIRLAELKDHLDKLPKDKEIVIVCEVGMRSSTAAGILERHGFTALVNLSDGIMAWRNADYPLVFEEDP